MRPAHLSRLRIPGATLDDLVRRHAEWALGAGPFAGLREARLAAGVPADLDVDAVVGDRGGDWSFKFSLPEPGGVTRSSAIRILHRGADVVVEHLVVRDGPPERLATPHADAPEIVRWMLANLPTIEPAQLRASQSSVVDELDVAALVAWALDPERTVPLLIVSVENASRAPLVDADQLTRRVAGMMTVHRLGSVRASYRLRDELTSVGLDEKLGCYNGGVRILWPGVRPGDNPYDHLLVLPVRLTGMPPSTRTEQVAGVFCELVAENEDLRRWIRDVEGPAPPPAERRPAPRPATPVTLGPRRTDEVAPPRPDSVGPVPPRFTSPPRLLPPPPVAAAPPIEPRSAPCAPIDRGAPPPDAATGDAPTVEAAAPPPAAAARELEPALEPAPASTRTTSKSTWLALADDLAAGLQLAEEQEKELETVRSELALARRDLRRAEQERDEIRGSLGPPRTVAAALAIAEALFAEQLIVLRSARASAEDSPYRDPARVLFVLGLLANCDVGGIGDVIHRALGTMARWKPKDSPETIKAFGRERTWTDASGALKTFGRHITLGHGVSAQKCLQIYYDVLADGRIEIAWCGEHRPTVGEDT